MNIFNLETKTRKLSKQIFRYGVVGVATNSLGYLSYLLITFLGGTPKITMSVLYGLGMMISFLANRKLTFDHEGSTLTAGSRYLIAHFFGYLINFSILAMMVDRMGFAHQWVQIIAILIVALFLFLMMRFYVFKETSFQDG